MREILIGGCVSLVITIIKNMMWKRVSLVNKSDNKINRRIECKLDKGKVLIIKFINKIPGMGSIWVLLGVVMGTWFECFNTIYCDPTNDDNNTSGESNIEKKNDTNNEKNNDMENKKVTGNSESNIDKNNDKNDTDKKTDNSDDKKYNFSGSVDKGAVKEAIQGVVEGIGSALPTVIGGFAGVSLGGTIMKVSGGLPPFQKAVLGVGTAVVGAFGVSTSAGLGREMVKNVCKSKEVESSGSGIGSASGSEVSESKGGNGVDGYIASVLEKGDELSPLQMILDYEIILGLLILI